MAEPFATSDDVAARWRPLTSDEETVAFTLLEDASDMIRVRWPDVDDRVEAGTLTVASLTRVTANMVKRAMLNATTEGVEAQSQTAGPFSVSNTYTNPNANLYLTADDIRILGGAASRRAFAVDLSANVAPCTYPARGYW